MRTIQEFHQRLVDGLPLALERPTMCGAVGPHADAFFGGILRELCWIDEREQDYQAVASELLCGCRWVHGQLLFQSLAIPEECCSEIASVYAQAAYRLGYFTPSRLLTAEQFQDLQASLDEHFFTHDHTEPEIVARFGEPAHQAIGGDTTVHSYGCTDAAVDWIYFDYSRRYPPTDPHVYEWFDEPILRDVRRKRNRFELLPFAEWCKTPTARKS